MENADKKSLNLVTLLKSIIKGRIDQIARICGEAIISIVDPEALHVELDIPGLRKQLLSSGSPQALKPLEDFAKLSRPFQKDVYQSPVESITISSGNGRLTSISFLRLGNTPIGAVSLFFNEESNYEIRPTEIVHLISSMALFRILSLLSPENPRYIQITGMRLITELQTENVAAVAIKYDRPDSPWNTLIFQNEEYQIEEIKSGGDLESLNTQSELTNSSTMKTLWPTMDLPAAIVIKEHLGQIFVLGFGDRKYINSKVKTKALEILAKYTSQDNTQLLHSFESLKADFKKIIRSERAAAVTETAVTINHEINNPLTAILGNTQLLLLNKDKLPEEIVVKLQAIERSAFKIKETTGKLMSIIEPVTTPYASGLRMIDLEKSKTKDNSNR